MHQQNQPDSRFGRSVLAEGDPEAFAEVIERTRRYFEIVPEKFPAPHTLQVRWFADGLYLVTDEESPMLYQVPMQRVADMIEPREHPNLPLIRRGIL